MNKKICKIYVFSLLFLVGCRELSIVPADQMVGDWIAAAWVGSGGDASAYSQYAIQSSGEEGELNIVPNRAAPILYPFQPALTGTGFEGYARVRTRTGESQTIIRGKNEGDTLWIIIDGGPQKPFVKL